MWTDHSHYESCLKRTLTHPKFHPLPEDMNYFTIKGQSDLFKTIEVWVATVSGTVLGAGDTVVWKKK